MTATNGKFKLLWDNFIQFCADKNSACDQDPRYAR